MSLRKSVYRTGLPIWTMYGTAKVIQSTSSGIHEWTGHKLMQGTFRKGRIPWAKSLNWKEFRQPVANDKPPTGFKTATELEKVIRKNGIDKNKHLNFSLSFPPARMSIGLAIC